VESSKEILEKPSPLEKRRKVQVEVLSWVWRDCIDEWMRKQQDVIHKRRERKMFMDRRLFWGKPDVYKDSRKRLG